MIGEFSWIEAEDSVYDVDDYYDDEDRFTIPMEKYYDFGDGRDTIFVIMPDGSYIAERVDEVGDAAHSEVIPEHAYFDFPEGAEGWCRGFTVDEERYIAFFPFFGWNLGWSGKEDAITKCTPKTRKAIDEIIATHASPGWNVFIEFEDFTLDYVYEGGK